MLDQRRRLCQCVTACWPAAEHADLVDVIADTLITVVPALMNSFRDREGTGALQLAIAIAEGAGLTSTALRGANNLGVMADTDPRARAPGHRGGLALARARGR